MNKTIYILLFVMLIVSIFTFYFPFDNKQYSPVHVTIPTPVKLNPVFFGPDNMPAGFYPQPFDFYNQEEDNETKPRNISDFFFDLFKFTSPNTVPNTLPDQQPLLDSPNSPKDNTSELTPSQFINNLIDPSMIPLINTTVPLLPDKNMVIPYTNNTVQPLPHVSVIPNKNTVENNNTTDIDIINVIQGQESNLARNINSFLIGFFA